MTRASAVVNRQSTPGSGFCPQGFLVGNPPVQALASQRPNSVSAGSLWSAEPGPASAALSADAGAAFAVPATVVRLFVGAGVPLPSGAWVVGRCHAGAPPPAGPSAPAWSLSGEWLLPRCRPAASGGPSGRFPSGFCVHPVPPSGGLPCSFLRLLT